MQEQSDSPGLVNLRPSTQRAELSLNTVECEASPPIASIPKVAEIDQQRKAETLYQHASGPDSDLAHENSLVPNSPEATEIGARQESKGTYGSFNPFIIAAKIEFFKQSSKISQAAAAQDKLKRRWWAKIEHLQQQDTQYRNKQSAWYQKRGSQRSLGTSQQQWRRKRCWKQEVSWWSKPAPYIVRDLNLSQKFKWSSET